VNVNVSLHRRSETISELQLSTVHTSHDIWIWRATVEGYWQGKTQCHFIHYKSHTADPGANPDLRDERPATVCVTMQPIFNTSRYFGYWAKEWSHMLLTSVLNWDDNTVKQKFVLEADSRSDCQEITHFFSRIGRIVLREPTLIQLNPIYSLNYDCLRSILILLSRPHLDPPSDPSRLSRRKLYAFIILHVQYNLSSVIS
jgi:hypothetical protein